MKNFPLLLVLGLCSLATACAQKKIEKPNIIVILADDLGWGDVGFHDSEIKTPHLDQLAAEGVELSRFYVAPVCSPTRAGLLTGRYPDRNGLRENVIPPWRDFGLDTTETTLPEVLAAAGYKNRAVIGKWHLGHSRKAYYPLNYGFTHFYGHLNGAINFFTHEREGELDWHDDYETSYDKGYSTDLLAADAVKSIQEYAEEGPFFIYLAFNAPHSPLQATEQDLAQYGYDASKPPYSKKRDLEGMGNTRRQTYSAMVTGLDRGVGRIMATLEEQGIADNTLILFFSDNGGDEGGKGGSSDPLRGHKFHEWEGGVRVPAVIKWPNGGLTGGKTIDQVMGYVDVMPTLSQLVSSDLEPNRPYDGMNMLPVLTGEKDEIDRYFYLGVGAIVGNDWKLLTANRNPKMEDLKEDALFHISVDPYEEKNVIQQHQDKADELRKVLMKYDTITPKQEVLPYHVGREGFKAPKEWDLFSEKL